MIDPVSHNETLERKIRKGEESVLLKGSLCGIIR